MMGKNIKYHLLSLLRELPVDVDGHQNIFHHILIESPIFLHTYNTIMNYEKEKVLSTKNYSIRFLSAILKPSVNKLQVHLYDFNDKGMVLK